jgi:hypothetical protein
LPDLNGNRVFNQARLEEVTVATPLASLTFKPFPWVHLLRLGRLLPDPAAMVDGSLLESLFESG